MSMDDAYLREVVRNSDIQIRNTQILVSNSNHQIANQMIIIELLEKLINKLEEIIK